MRLFTIAVAVLVALGFSCDARAESLQRLTVTTFTLNADEAAPKIEVPFHLVLAVHVNEHISRLDNVVLPILNKLELLGDERRCLPANKGTTCTETITVVSHLSGEIKLDPATLDAIDARDDKGKRYFSNELTLQVGGGISPWEQTSSTVSTLAWGAVHLLAYVLGLLCAVAIVVALYRRRPKPVVVAPAPVQEPISIPARQHDPRADLRDALVTLRVSQTRATAMQVRTLVRRMVGASDVETLYDVLARPDAKTPVMRDLLRSLERAAFTNDADLPGAIDGAIASLEHAVA